MRRSYWPTGIVLGALLGFTVYVTTENIALGILAGVGLSVVGILVILGIEKLVNKGVDAGAAAIKNAIDKKRAQGESAQPTSAGELIALVQSGETISLAGLEINSKGIQYKVFFKPQFLAGEDFGSFDKLNCMLRNKAGMGVWKPTDPDKCDYALVSAVLQGLFG